MAAQLHDLQVQQMITVFTALVLYQTVLLYSSLEQKIVRLMSPPSFMELRIHQCNICTSVLPWSIIAIDLGLSSTVDKTKAGLQYNYFNDFVVS